MTCLTCGRPALDDDRRWLVARDTKMKYNRETLDIMEQWAKGNSPRACLDFANRTVIGNLVSDIKELMAINAKLKDELKSAEKLASDACWDATRTLAASAEGIKEYKEQIRRLESINAGYKEKIEEIRDRLAAYEEGEE